jgi:tetratricopeptide (TPR) repeat protein
MLPALLLAGCAHRPPPQVEDPLVAQQARADVEGPDQTLEVCRLASLALREGRDDVAEAALRRAVGKMQDFRADGEFRAMVGAESSKEWKGDPYEKMMAFLDLGLLLYAKGDYGNALAMSKSAILADTGTSGYQYRADFVAAFVLQALTYQRLGEPQNADRSMTQAVDALYVRELTAILSDRLVGVEVDGDPSAVAAARVLLLAGLPAGLNAHPRDPLAAIDGALSRATDLRQVALDDSAKDWPDDLRGVSRGALRRASDALDPLARGWRDAVQRDGAAVPDAVTGDATLLQDLLAHPPRALVWVQAGLGPTKVADGRYGEILRVVPQSEPAEPRIRLDGQPIGPAYLDSVTYQAQTRGGRKVDGFLKGKAVFKDAAPFVGWALLEAGDVANALRNPRTDDGAVAAALYLAGAAVWVAGAVTNPRADTRAWDDLPDTLWLVGVDPGPGTHELRVDGVTRTFEIGDLPGERQPVSILIPGGGR